MPEVTVVIPTRSRSRMLMLALHTALYQRDVDLEVIVVDDGSTDDTAAVVSAVRDARVRLIRNATPQGVSAARNRGIADASGAWVAFLDDDDVWAPDKLALQLEALRTTGRHWVYGGEVSVDDALQILGGAPPAPPEEVVASLVRHDSVPAGASNVVVDRAALDKVGLFDISLRTSEDWDLWLRLARRGPPAWVCRPLVAYRVHRTNASRDMPRVLQELRLVQRRHSISVDRPAHLRWAAWTSLEDGRGARAVWYYARAVALGDIKSAARALVALLSVAFGFPVNRSWSRQRSRDLSWIEATDWLQELGRPETIAMDDDPPDGR